MSSFIGYAGEVRAPYNQPRIWLSVLTGKKVLTATVNALPGSPAKALSITVTSGNASDVRRGFRVVVKTDAGLYKGTTAVRAGGTMDSTTLPIRETSVGLIWFSVGDIIEVWDDIYPIDKLVENDQHLRPDGVPVGTLNTQLAPIPNSGGAVVGWLGTPIPMYGSLAVSRSGNGINHLWSSPLSIVTGTDTSADPVFEAEAAGSYLIEHLAADAVTGAARTQYNRVRIHDENDPPIPCSIEGVQASPELGWALTVQAHRAVSLEELPQYAPCAVWIEGQYFGQPVYTRSNILMMGYARREGGLIAPKRNTLHFDLISPIAAYQEILGLSKVMLGTAGDSWMNLPGLTVARGIEQILLHYTWLNEAGHDLIYNGFSDAAYPNLFIDKQNPVAQVRELAAGRTGRVVELRSGRIEIQGKLDVVPLADRHTLDVSYTVNPEDVYAGDGEEGIEWEVDHADTLDTFRAKGFQAGSSEGAIYFARYPDSPGTGTQSPVQEKLIADDLQHFFLMTAMLGAAARGVYTDENGAVTKSPSVTFKMAGMGWALWDFHRAFVRIEGYEALSNLRGRDLTATRYQFMGAALEFGAEWLTTVRLQGETAGTQAGAVDDTPPAGDDIGTPPTTDPIYQPYPPYFPPILPPPVPPVAPPVTLPPGTERVAIITGDGYLALTQSANNPGSNGGAFWEAEQVIVAALLDAVEKVGDPTTAFAVNEGYIYRITGIGSGSPSAEVVHTFGSAPAGVRRVIDTCEADPDWIIVRSYHPILANTAAYTLDGGDTWDSSQVSTYLDGVLITDGCGEISTNFATWTGGASGVAAHPVNYPFSVYGTSAGGGTTVNVGGRNDNGHNHKSDAYTVGGVGIRVSCPVAVLADPCTVQTVSFWFNMEMGAGSTGLRIMVRFFDDSKTLISDSTLFPLTTVNSSINGWTQYSWSGAVSDVKYVAINADSGTSGNPQLRIDDVVINAGGGSGGGGINLPIHTPVIATNPRLPGYAHTIAFNAAGEPACYHTDDYGETWTELASPNLNVGFRLGSYLAVPRSDRSKYWATYAFGAAPYTFQLLRAKGATQSVAYSPMVGSTTYAPGGEGRQEISIAPNDANKMIVIGRPGGNSESTGIWSTRSGGQTWTQRYAPSTANAKFKVVQIGSNGESVYLLGTDTFIYSPDLLATRDDRSGNLAALDIGDPLCVFRW